MIPATVRQSPPSNAPPDSGKPSALLSRQPFDRAGSVRPSRASRKPSAPDSRHHRTPERRAACQRFDRPRRVPRPACQRASRPPFDRGDRVPRPASDDSGDRAPVATIDRAAGFRQAVRPVSDSGDRAASLSGKPWRPCAACQRFRRASRGEHRNAAQPFDRPRRFRRTSNAGKPSGENPNRKP